MREKLDFKSSHFCRLVCYQPEESQATLSAHHASTEHRVVIHTLFVEPFNSIIGAQYLVLGEVENADGKYFVLSTKKR